MSSRSLSTGVALALSTLLAAGAATAGPAAAAPTASATPAAAPAAATNKNKDTALYRQSFDSLADKLAPRSSDPGIEDGASGFTHEAPAGWDVAFDDSMAAGGVDEWRGWSFTTREFWTDAEDQKRNRFARSHNVMAVADSDEYDDADRVPHDFATTLTSEPVRVKGEERVALNFDSHYRGWAGQSGVVSVSFDGGEATELLRLDEATVENDDDGSELNATHALEVDVPAGARNAVFSWEFTAEANSWYWAIDSVSVNRVLEPAAGAPTSAWVVSDVQGHPEDLREAFDDYAQLRPDADGLLMVGDTVDSGAAGEWEEIYDVFDDAAELLPRQRVAAIGNHERYAPGGFEANRDRFLEFAERDKVWGEYILEGDGGDVPVIVLGQDAAGPTDVPMSEDQLVFLEERLAYWTEQKKQVLVMTHFPLGDTVSATWIPWYSEHHQHNDRLTELFGEHPNAVVLSGHTHYPAELGDWAVQRRTDGGHPDGFWNVQTLAFHNEWDARGEDTEGIREVVTRDIARGLTIDSYGDRLVVTARDFAADREIRSVTIPNPLVNHTASTAR